MKIAKEKVWLTSDGKVVEDGHKDAHELLAIEGQTLPDKRLEKIAGADKFFYDPHGHSKTVAPEDASERSDRTVKPQAHRHK